MKEIVVKNKEVLNILNELLWFYDNRDELKKCKLPNNSKKYEDYGDEYLQQIISMGSSHNGYPEVARGYALRQYDLNQPQPHGFDIPWSLQERFNKISDKLQQELSLRNLAVATVYPPEGFISWHSNANATGFNLIFTWSETGDGYFNFIDENGEKINLPDKKGEWVCRYGMFGAYNQTKYPVVYHEAYTKCWRMTFAFIFSAHEASAEIQQFIIEELETP